MRAVMTAAVFHRSGQVDERLATIIMMTASNHRRSRITEWKLIDGELDTDITDGTVDHSDQGEMPEIIIGEEIIYYLNGLSAEYCKTEEEARKVYERVCTEKGI